MGDAFVRLVLAAAQDAGLSRAAGQDLPRKPHRVGEPLAEGSRGRHQMEMLAHNQEFCN